MVNSIHFPIVSRSFGAWGGHEELPRCLASREFQFAAPVGAAVSSSSSGRRQSVQINCGMGDKGAISIAKKN